MRKFTASCATLILLTSAALPARAWADSGESTRVTDTSQHASKGCGSHPYRQKSEYILKELDLRAGDVVVDIGAGDGWWSERMAKIVGGDGIIYAAEVDRKLVEEMKKKYANLPQVRPYLCPNDGTALSEGTCDLAFFSQSYHHLSHNSHVNYLEHLRKVVKPTGRVCIIERYTQIGGRGQTHGTVLSELIEQAEEAGWVPVRCELITGTYHFIAIFVQKELFPPEPQSPSKTPNILVEVDALKRQLADSNLRVVDTRSETEYERAHIPGAVRVNPDEWRKLAAGANGLHDSKRWADAVGGLGIDHKTRVVVYGDTLPDAARVWWTLKYLALADVRMLNGGWKAWDAAYGPAQTAAPKVAARDFEPRSNPDRLAEMDDLKKLLKNPKVTIVDVRSLKEFTGEDARGPRGGHIPGAIHLEWSQLLKEDGRFKSPVELGKLFAERGIQPANTAVTYCQTGGRAAVAAFALELAGFKSVKNFYGSWEQWSPNLEAPVEQGAKNHAKKQ